MGFRNPLVHETLFSGTVDYPFDEIPPCQNDKDSTHNPNADET